jgi:hypothetical protein
MATITPNYQIAAGNNNAAGLTLITDITDGDGVAFVMPRGLPHRIRGDKRFRLDGTVGRVGQDSTRFVSSVMTLAQYKYVLDTYEGLVTVKIALSQTTFANYNASLWMPDEDELEYVYLVGSSAGNGYTGPGYKDVAWNLNTLVAL